MSDSEKNKTNNDVDEINVSDKLSDKGGRTSDIYERFITRVQSITGETEDESTSDESINNVPASGKKASEAAETLAGFEPLSEEELGFFLSDDSFVPHHSDTPDDLKKNITRQNATANTQSTQQADTTSQPIATDTTQSPSLSATDANTVSTDDKKQWRQRKSHGNLIIISVILALGLSAIILVALSATGQLTRLNDVISTDTSSTQSDDNLPLNPQKSDAPPKVATSVEPPSEPLTTDSNAPLETRNDSGVNNSEIDNNKINNSDASHANAANLPKESTVSAAPIPISNPSTDANREDDDSNAIQDAPLNGVISVDEFREEAQSTLYREVTD